MNMHCALDLGTNRRYETLLGELDLGLLSRRWMYLLNACIAHYVDLGTNRHYETLVDLGSACYLARRAEHWLNTENNTELSVGPRV